MKYGIVVCPKCKTAKGVNLSQKSTKCFKCGKVLQLEKLKILHKTDSDHQLRYYLGLVNAEMGGELDNFMKKVKG